jgi:hypothetical protein
VEHGLRPDDMPVVYFSPLARRSNGVVYDLLLPFRAMRTPLAREMLCLTINLTRGMFEDTLYHCKYPNNPDNTNNYLDSSYWGEHTHVSLRLLSSVGIECDPVITCGTLAMIRRDAKAYKDLLNLPLFTQHRNAQVQLAEVCRPFLVSTLGEALQSGTPEGDDWGRIMMGDLRPALHESSWCGREWFDLRPIHECRKNEPNFSRFLDESCIFSASQLAPILKHTPLKGKRHVFGTATILWPPPILPRQLTNKGQAIQEQCVLLQNELFKFSKDTAKQ